MFCNGSSKFLVWNKNLLGLWKKCDFEVDPAEKKQILKANMPGGFAVYSFGFFVVFSAVLDGPITIALTSFTSALLLSHFVVSMAMPALKRNPSIYTKEPL